MATQELAARRTHAQASAIRGHGWALPAMLFVLLGAAALRLLALFDVPGGVLYDEAYNAVDAATAFRELTPFFHANFGRESGFIYLQALAIQIFGYSGFALRFPAACLGLLTIAASYALFARLFRRHVGILASAWLAWSLWHVIFSRTGLRANALPLALILVFYCYARGMSAFETGDAKRWLAGWRWFILAGILLGLSQYTYAAARFAPLAILAVALLQVLAKPAHARRCIRAVAIVGLAALAVFLPLGLYFLAHPADFFERARQVSAIGQGPEAVPASALANSILATVGIFGGLGDRNWDRNIAGLPALDPLTFALFIIGMGIAIWRWRRLPSQLALSWLAIMLIPHAATATFIPNYLRAVGVLPVMFAFPALAVDSIWASGALRTIVRASRWRARGVLLALLVMGMLAGASVTAWRYFSIWANHPVVQDMFTTSLAKAYALGYEARLADPEARVYVAIPGAGEGTDPLSFFYERAARPRGTGAPIDAPRPFVGAESLVIPPPGKRAVYLAGSPLVVPAPLRSRHLAGAASVFSSGGVETIDVLTPALSVEQPFQARWQDVAEIVGYALPRRVQAGEALDLVLYWRVLRQDPLNIRLFAHLVDGSRNALAKMDADVSLLTHRAPDETVAQLFHISIPNNAITGAYWASVGLYRQPSLERFRVLDPQGRDAGDSFLLGPFKVAALAVSDSSISAPLQFGGQVGLRGFELSSLKLPRGGTLSVDLRWLALQAPAADYTVFLQLLDADNRVISQVDQQPQGGRYPTRLWDPAESVDYVVDIAIPPTAPLGPTTLILGLYDSAGRRLAVAGPEGRARGDHAVLGVLAVEH